MVPFGCSEMAIDAPSLQKPLIFQLTVCRSVLNILPFSKTGHGEAFS